MPYYTNTSKVYSINNIILHCVKTSILSVFPARLFAHVTGISYLCVSEGNPWPTTGKPRRRRLLPKRNSKLYFLPAKPKKVTLPASAKLGAITSQLGNLIKGIMRKELNAKYKYKRLELYLKPEEETLFRRKAARYKTISAMIRDAVKQFDDTATRGKIDAINRMTDLYLKHQQELSWLGGNFNQTVKRANELAIGQQLTPQFFEQVLYPQVEQIQALLHDIKREQHQIAKQLTHF